MLVEPDVRDDWGSQADVRYTRMRYEIEIARGAGDEHRLRDDERPEDGTGKAAESAEHEITKLATLLAALGLVLGAVDAPTARAHRGCWCRSPRRP